MSELICFTNANYGGGRGLGLMPLDRIELFVSASPYITHTKPGLNDGIGDMTFLFKYRAAAGNPEHGNIPGKPCQELLRGSRTGCEYR